MSDEERDGRPAIERIKERKDGLDVLWDLLAAAEHGGYDALSPDEVQLAKWWGVYPQRPEGSGDLMLRVRVPNGALTSVQLRAIGELAVRYGRDLADITTRQCIQLHWLRVEQLPDIFRAFDRVGLTSAQACGDVWRNIVGCPLTGVSGDELFDSSATVEALSQHFVGNRRFSNLPRKFKVSVCSCTHHCAQHEINDIGLVGIVHPELGAGYDVWVGGGLGASARLGRRLDVFIRPEEAVEVTSEITALYRDNGNRVKRTRARIKFLIDEWGPELFRERLEQRLGRALPRSIVPTAAASPHRDHIGATPQRANGYYAVGGATLRGRTSGRELIELAAIAERHGAGRVRLTNRQNAIVLDVPAAALETASAELTAIGFPPAATSFRRQTISCTGIEFCRLSVSETKQVAAEIIDHLEHRLGDLEPPVRINVNGCPNACAQYQVADIGLQGALARRDGAKVMGFQLHIGGRLGEDPRFGKRTAKPVAAEDVRFVLERIVVAFRDERGADETFGAWLDRQEKARLEALIGGEVLPLRTPGDTAYLPDAPAATPVVGAAWLAARLDDPSLAVLEVSEDADAFRAGHVPGARELSWRGALVDPDGRTLPADQTQLLLGRIGVAPDATVVLYGDRDNALAARAARVLVDAGHADVRLLDGGRRGWIGSGRELERIRVEAPAVAYAARAVPNGASSASVDDVTAVLGRPDAVIVDLRSAEAYESSHVPGATNLDADALQREDGLLVPHVELLRRFEEAGARPGREVVLYHETGGEAALPWFVATRMLGLDGVRVLDGGFAEWRGRGDCPVADAGDYDGAEAPLAIEGD